MVAIVWGLVSIIVLMALGEGFYQHYSASFSLLNSDSQLVWPSQTSKPWQGLPARRNIRITEQQVELLRNSPFVEQLAVVYENWEAQVSDAHGLSITSFVAGTEGSYLPLVKQGLTNRDPPSASTRKVGNLDRPIPSHGPWPWKSLFPRIP